MRPDHPPIARVLLFTLLAAALAVAACEGGDDALPSPADETAPDGAGAAVEPSTTPPESARSSAPPAAAPAPSPPGALAYEPPPLSVPAGLTVRPPGPCAIEIHGLDPFRWATTGAGDRERPGTFTYRFTYDEGGGLLRTERESATGLAWTERAYDEAGDEILRENGRDGDTTDRLVVTWNDDRTERTETRTAGDGETQVAVETYDARGHILSWRGEEGRGWTFGWEDGLPAWSEQDADGDGAPDRRDTYEWDDAGRLVRAIGNVGGFIGGGALRWEMTREISYDDEGRRLLERLTEPGDYELRRSYARDAAGALQEVRTETDAQVFDQTLFDEAGRPALQRGYLRGELVDQEAWAYDEDGRLAVWHSYREGRTTWFGHDGAGNLLWQATAAPAERDAPRADGNADDGNAADGIDWVSLVTYDYGCWSDVADPPPPVRNDGRGCLPFEDARLRPEVAFLGMLAPMVMPYHDFPPTPCMDDLVQ